MKNTLQHVVLTSILMLAALAPAKTIVVNTADNLTPGPGQTNLVLAINLLQDGDTIQFNIPGTGPHYLVSPPGGYPIITNINNVTIDGYSQPGSSPNTNPILSSNNANITIVLDARNANFTTLQNSIPGYGTTEVAILFVLGSTNFSVRGICFLGTWDYVNQPYDSYAVAFGGDQPSHFGHVSGCRFGLDLDGKTVARLKDSVTAFGSGPNNDIVVGVGKDATNAAAARAQFNVMIGEQIPVIIEGNGTRISGNFFNVFPDGLHEFHADVTTLAPDQTLEAFIEIGSYGDNVVIGTDGDGVNDADERNVFGGVTDADDHRILEWYGGTRTNNIVAGNYIGVGVDGKTVFTNGGPTMEVIEGFNSTTTVQVGSDFDGVSDDIEANHIYWNHPFSGLYGNPPDLTLLSGRWRFAALSAGALVSLRGNVLINNDLAPYTYGNGGSGLLPGFTNYYAPYMDTNASIIPGLDSTNSIYPRLAGTFAVGIVPYTNIIIDVYQLDQEGWTNGQQFGFTELIDPSTGLTNGFPQGSKYLGSFPVTNTGSFDIDISGLDLGLGWVTVTANYSADPPGTHRGRTHTSNFSNPITVNPGGVASVGLTHIVPDVACWYDQTGSFVTNGPVKLAEAEAVQSNWEPYTSVLGDSTFLVGFNTYADDQTVPPGASYSGPAQRFVVAFQPAAGGAAKIGEHYFNDAGAPFRAVVNLSRENGNPQRVAGDKRIGATNFITASETSLGQLAAFQSNSRWTNNPLYQADNRYVTEQVFSLDPSTLAQTPSTKAWDYVYGPFVANAIGAPGNAPQFSRTGGRSEFLNNGNIVVMIDDKTGLVSTAGEVTTFAIITPEGAVVKGPTLVDPHAIWDNMAAFQGGFAIRVGVGTDSILYFYDNAGNPTHTNYVNASSGLSFGTDRGDGHRIGSDIRSHYVYVAGQTPAKPQAPVSVAIFDSRTGNFVAQTTVTDTDPTVSLTDRVSIAVDALDRFCVAYVFQPNSDFQQQVAARVMAFDGTNITSLTHSFFPFVNYESNPTNILGLKTFGPNVSMTTRQICIAAKGSFNSTNNPAGGPDTAAETTLYTVINHPGAVPSAPLITVANVAGNLVVSWPADAGTFTLQSTAKIAPTSWSPVTPQPPTVQVGNNFQMTMPISAGNVYFRLAR
jgi:hypothetical protein